VNRLGSQTSPYLRQHADNPVHWWPWCTEAFEEARRRDVPVLLSVGYSACHWCHVMAHESFEDAETARRMNEGFVNVKVDREERPDVDSIYMDAVQALSGRGGWPMTVFLAPDARPFFGGTYYPRAAFHRLLEAVADAWRDRREDVHRNLETLTEVVGRTARLAPQRELPDRGVVDAAVAHLCGAFDREWGGFGGAPKFPSTMNLELVLRAHADGPGDDTREVLVTSLDAMASGGMYDHIGGGFARYSVDERWLVPHFEKMLYDQALLVRLYTRAALVFGGAEAQRWRQVVGETVAFVLREMREPEGGFASAFDADSDDGTGHAHEGRFVTFTPAELREVLGEPLAGAAAAWWGITPGGNFEGRSIPHRLGARGAWERPPEIERARTLLREARERRPRPLRDDKVILEWNGLMAASLAEAGAAFDAPDWVAAARAAVDFVAREMRGTDGRWRRSWQRDGTPRARHAALAADLACLVDAATRVSEAAGEARWLAVASEAAEQLLAHHWDAALGGCFTVADDADALIVRQKDLMDGATPAANSVAASALARLAALTGREDLAARADDVLRLAARLSASTPSGFGHLLGALHTRLADRVEIVVPGRAPELMSVVHETWRPHAVIAWGEPSGSPLWLGRAEGAAYVCRDRVCAAPARTPAELRRALAG
jgi:uncharacterized protein YyaL (SSP411 family)